MWQQETGSKLGTDVFCSKVPTSVSFESGDQLRNSGQEQANQHASSDSSALNPQAVYLAHCFSASHAMEVMELT